MQILIKPLIVTYIILLLPATILSAPSNKPPVTILCPENIESALASMKDALGNRIWINIDNDACPHIQSEIVDNASTIVQSKDFHLYLAMMNFRTIRLVRNTIFALKGYRFRDNDLRMHFARFEWYKPTDRFDNKGIKLTNEDKRRIRLLKRIEETWRAKRHSHEFTVPSQQLPQGVTIIQKGDKRVLDFGEQKLDVTQVTYGEGYTERFYTVRGNEAQGIVLVCSQHRYGDSLFIDEMTLYSSDGKVLHSSVNQGPSIGGLGLCPFWIPERPEILLSYNNSGCCGATWDILATFDSQLKPSAVLDCGEEACSGTSFFADVNEGNIYMSVAAEGDPSIDKTHRTFQRIDYGGYTGKHVSFEEQHVDTWAIWRIEQDGHLKLAAKVTETVHYQQKTPGSWLVIVEKPYQKIDLMSASTTDRRLRSAEKIITSAGFGNTLILFRASKTIVVPLA